jgi:chromosome segregation ATPase
MENVCEAAVQAIMSHCEKTVAEITAELNHVKAQIDRIGRLELRLTQLNTSVEQTRTQIVDQIRGLAEKYDQLLGAVEQVDRDFTQRCDGIEARLAILEDEENRPNYATKTELEEVVARTRAMFDGRLQEIEQQIGQVHHNISDLMLNAGRRQTRPEGAGSVLLSDLAKEPTH